MEKKKYNYTAQENVVEALWNLLRDNQKNLPNATNIDPEHGDTSAYLPAIEDALEVIMGAFGFEVQPVD